MAFANILDISSFFIGMLINLLLIALICYYFKRKYESLEMAQNEQAKILYNLIQQQQPRKQFNIEDLMKNHVENVNLDKVVESDSKSKSGSDSDNDSESDSDDDSDLDNDSEQVLDETIHVNEIKKIQLDLDLVESISQDIEVKSEEIEMDSDLTVTKLDDYGKMTIKQLKDILSKKGISSNNKMKKTELIQLIEGEPTTLNLSEELNEVNI